MTPNENFSFEPSFNMDSPNLKTISNQNNSENSKTVQTENVASNVESNDQDNYMQGRWVSIGDFNKKKTKDKTQMSAASYLRAVRKSYAKNSFKYKNERDDLSKERNLYDFDSNLNQSKNKPTQNINVTKEQNPINPRNPLVQKLITFNQSRSNDQDSNVFDKIKSISNSDKSKDSVEYIDHQNMTELRRKTSRILKAEHKEHEMIKGLRTELKQSSDELHKVYDKVSKIESDDKYFNELKNIKDLIKTQIEVVNHRLSGLDQKESAMSEKIVKLDDLSKSMKILLHNVNDLISEKVEQNIRMTKLNDKINKDTSNLRRHILINERRLRELQDHYNVMKHKMSIEEKTITEHKISSLQSKIDSYKKYVPPADDSKVETNNTNLLDLQKQIQDTLENNHSLFDDSKLKDMYHEKPSIRNNNLTNRIALQDKVQDIKYLPKPEKKHNRFLDFVSKFF